MTDETNGLAPSEPAVDIAPSGDKFDQAFNAAFDKHVEAEAPPADDGKTEDTRARDEVTGRFAKKSPDAEASIEESADASKPADDQQQQPDPALQPIAPPERWTEADKTAFAALPREAQQLLVDRNRAMEADYTRKSQEVAELRRNAEPLLNVAQQHQPYLAQFGLTPATALPILVQAHQTLMTGPVEQRVQALARLAADAGIDLAAMSRGEVAAPDPAYQQLRQELNQLKQSQEQERLSREQEQNQQLALQIDAFANSKTADGQPKYPHFGAVRGVMARLYGSGEASTLEEAYEKATQPIRDAVAAELKARQDDAKKADQQALEKARKAAPVKSVGTAPNGIAKAKGLDAILSEAMAKAGMN